MLTVELYRTSDNKIFDNELKAIEHQIDLLGEELDGFLPRDDRGNVTQSDRFNLLIKQLSDPEIFSKILKLCSIVEYMQEYGISAKNVNDIANRKKY